MRFLNLKLSSPDISDIKIEFSDNINIISIPDKKLYNLFTQLPAAAMYGKNYEGAVVDLKDISYTINAVSNEHLRASHFIFNDKDHIKNESDISIKKINGDTSNNTQEKATEVVSYTDFITSSVYYPELFQKNEDPVFNKQNIQSILVNDEIYRQNFPYFHNRETLLQKKEKELTNLNRDKQLLELKKMKKEKLLKEIQISERGINKLEKRSDSILNYRTTLDEIVTKIEFKNKILLKINNLKKDLIELRELKEKITNVEKILREKFAHFSEKGNEQIPDLEKIQESFNFFRDINEQLDKFFLTKKRYSGWTLKIAASMLIFSIIALVFILFTSTASIILERVSLIAACAAGITGLLYLFKIRTLQPSDLFEQKKKMETALIDLLRKNNFAVDDFKTGELYEILFQYFEDFINYRDISYELIELKKRISNSASMIEKEKKLELLSEEIRNIDIFINDTLYNLDHSIHPVPDQDGIARAIHDINELHEETMIEINEKKLLIKKFEEEIEEYDKTENSSLSIEVKLEQLLIQIDECREKIINIKFLDDVFKNASDLWSAGKMQELSSITLKKFLQLTDNSFIKEDIANTINNIIVNSDKIKSEHKGLKKYIIFSIKAALSELLSSDILPPLFIFDPFTSDNEFADNMKKLLPDLFPKRQVVVIIPGNEPDLIGNLITL